MIKTDTLGFGAFAVGSALFLILELSQPFTGVFRLPGGSIAFQALTVPGPAHKQLAITGGTGSYANLGGGGTLVEFNQFHES